VSDAIAKLLEISREKLKVELAKVADRDSLNVQEISKKIIVS